MKTDPAEFRKTDEDAVYPQGPVCFETLMGPSINIRFTVDRQHILGRGDTGDREMFSSIFNLAYLIRPIHEGPMRDKKGHRNDYLDHAYKHVQNAVNAGRYVIKDLDYRFLAHAQHLRDTGQL